jgi:hypothetical protein
MALSDAIGNRIWGRSDPPKTTVTSAPAQLSHRRLRPLEDSAATLWSPGRARSTACSWLSRFFAFMLGRIRWNGRVPRSAMVMRT